MSEDSYVWTLERLMGWDADEVRREYRWLRMMARLKYDSYQDYSAGLRFLPSLVAWLQQFDTEADREVAYRFVRDRLIYVSPAEFRRLVELFFPVEVRRSLVKKVTDKTGVPAYRQLVEPVASGLYRQLLRKTLFLGLSDGARLDLFRRANAGTITNEQVVVATQLDAAKWQDLIGDLKRSLADNDAKFSTVYLIDDFTASGTSLIRKTEGAWKGKLARFFGSISNQADEYFDHHWDLYVHHYIAGPDALVKVKEREIAAAREAEPWHHVAKFSAGLELPRDVKVSEEADAEFRKLCLKHYNECFETRHTREGGTQGVALGFGECALPLVLEHNTPNNSVLLLWGDTEEEDGGRPLVRPLFRRRQRHGREG